MTIHGIYSVNTLADSNSDAANAQLSINTIENPDLSPLAANEAPPSDDNNMTTLAVGEEGQDCSIENRDRDRYTTFAIGEEGQDCWPHLQPGDNRYITLAIGEEGQDCGNKSEIGNP